MTPAIKEPPDAPDCPHCRDVMTYTGREIAHTDADGRRIRYVDTWHCRCGEELETWA